VGVGVRVGVGLGAMTLLGVGVGWAWELLWVDGFSGEAGSEWFWVKTVARLDHTPMGRCAGEARRQFWLRICTPAVGRRKGGCQLTAP
jgi:hypothetical protein